MIVLRQYSVYKSQSLFISTDLHAERRTSFSFSISLASLFKANFFCLNPWNPNNVTYNPNQVARGTQWCVNVVEGSQQNESLPFPSFSLRTAWSISCCGVYSCRSEVCLHLLHLPAPDVMLAEVQTVQVACTPPAPPAPSLHHLHRSCTASAPPAPHLHLSKHLVLHFLHLTPQMSVRLFRFHWRSNFLPMNVRMIRYRDDGQYMKTKDWMRHPITLKAVCCILLNARAQNPYVILSIFIRAHSACKPFSKVWTPWTWRGGLCCRKWFPCGMCNYVDKIKDPSLWPFERVDRIG